MKKIFLSLFAVAAVAISAVAQEKILPRTEYTVSLSENTVQVKPGESTNITVSIVRSKSYSKAEATLGLSSGLPEGITVTYAPAEGMFESSVATITASTEAKAGEYQLILKTTVNNKIKGSIVKLVVNSSTTSITAGN
jgi:uncharacterized membrane protein